MNVFQYSEYSAGMTWKNIVIVSSGALLFWLLGVTVFEALYKQARQGQKIAYLTLASFVFLMMVLGFTLMAEHAAQTEQVSLLWEPLK